MIATIDFSMGTKYSHKWRKNKPRITMILNPRSPSVYSNFCFRVRFRIRSYKPIILPAVALELLPPFDGFLLRKSRHGEIFGRKAKNLRNWWIDGLTQVGGKHCTFDTGL